MGLSSRALRGLRAITNRINQNDWLDAAALYAKPEKNAVLWPDASHSPLSFLLRTRRGASLSLKHGKKLKNQVQSQASAFTMVQMQKKAASKAPGSPHGQWPRQSAGEIAKKSQDGHQQSPGQRSGHDHMELLIRHGVHQHPPSPRPRSFAEARGRPPRGSEAQMCWSTGSCSNAD